MLSAAIRVLARSATIQLEEIAASHAVQTSRKGKERALDQLPSAPTVASQNPLRDETPFSSASTSDALHADRSTSPLRETTQTLGKSAELLEAEEKIQRLIAKAKLGIEQLNDHVRQPGTIPPPDFAEVLSHASDGQAGPSIPRRGESDDEPSKIDSRLSESARQPRTLQPSTVTAGTRTHEISTGSPFVGPQTAGIEDQKSRAESMLSQHSLQPKTIPPASHPSHIPSESIKSTPSTSSDTTGKPSVAVASSPTLTLPPSSGSASPSGSASASTSSAPETILDTSISNQPDIETAELQRMDKEVPASDEDTPVMLRASRVPSSRLGRLFHYGSLAASLSFGAASESFKRSTGGTGQGSVFMSDANVRRLVSTLGRMRGAALKLGQFMSIQDNHMLPPEIEKVLQQVQAHANYMPDWQMEKVMSDELGSNWQSLFSSFDRVPIASASIGQVHKATLANSDTPVAVKIQFPGIAGSINSDLANLSILIRSSALLPKGLYLQNTIAVMRRELEDECDYIREASSGRKFHDFLAGDDFFTVPKVVDECTTGKVLTTEWMSGKPLSRMKGMSQETRDKIGKNILRLCLQELFKFRFMQTDPNWANFLYDTQNDKVQLIDFGASREYTKEFMDGWFRLLSAALKGDREIMKIESENLGYLTGEENEEMLKAHLDSMALVASPFAHEGPYPFANQTITDSVRALIPIMLKHRLTPPPSETYSLNRKLSGAFLMCARLGANVDCGKLWEEEVAGYKEG